MRITWAPLAESFYYKNLAAAIGLTCGGPVHGTEDASLQITLHPISLPAIFNRGHHQCEACWGEGRASLVV